jgi:DNA-binding LacI/PurR family transcriptional regulator
LHEVFTGYGRDLRRRQTNRIGFSFGFTTTDIGEFASRLINGAVAAAEKADFNVILYPLAGDQLGKLTRICQRREVEGLLLMGGGHLLESIALLQERQIPFVVLNRKISQPNVSYVTVDHHQAVGVAVRHLIDHGHKRIAFIGQPILGGLHEDRLNGFRETMQQAGLAVDDSSCVAAGPNPGDGYRAMRELLAAPNRPTAVATIHDPFAIECLQAVVEAGLRVPDDVAIIGSDNLRETQATNPPLSTLHPALSKLGRLAMESLLNILDDQEAAPQRLSLPVKLLSRQSTVGLNADSSLVPARVDDA